MAVVVVVVVLLPVVVGSRMCLGLGVKTCHHDPLPAYNCHRGRGYDAPGIENAAQSCLLLSSAPIDKDADVRFDHDNKSPAGTVKTHIQLRAAQ